MQAKGMTHQEAVKVLNDAKVNQQLEKMADRKEALQQEAIAIQEKYSKAETEESAKVQASVGPDELLEDRDPRSLTYKIIQQQKEQEIETFVRKVDAQQIQEQAELKSFKAKYGADFAEPLEIVSERTPHDVFMSFGYEHGLYCPAVHRVFAKIFGDIHVDVTKGDVASAAFFMGGGRVVGPAAKAAKPLAKVAEPILAKSMRGMEKLAKRFGAKVSEIPELFKNPDVMKRGLQYEDHVATKLPTGYSRLKQNHPTFDFFDRANRKAISVKSLDTQTAAKLADPKQIYSSIRQNVNKAINYTGKKGDFLPSEILSRELRVGIPVKTNTAQWQQIQRAVQYGKEYGVEVIIEAIK
jgi:filamentous hemagglutinin